MKTSIKRIIKTSLSPLWQSRLARLVFTRHFYRYMIIPSERVIALRKTEESLGDSYWAGRLRKFAHIVDKGLQRRDFTKGHGMTAYGQAKRALSYIRSDEYLNDPSVKWAAKRLREYEDFQKGLLPQTAREYVKTTCSYDHLINAIKTRRSLRSYVQRPVTDQTVRKIVEVIDWSPTSCNRQTARVYATNNPELVKRCTAACSGAACFTDIYAPLFFSFCADMRLYEMPHELQLPYVDVALGVQNCNLVAHSLGISMTMLTWAQHTTQQERQLRRILKIPKHYQIIVNAVAGYPDGGVDAPARKNTELILVH